MKAADPAAVQREIEEEQHGFKMIPDDKIPQPLGTQVYIQLKVMRKVGHIDIPETSQVKSALGLVRARGPGIDLTEFPVTVGDWVYISQYAGHDIELREDDNLTVIGTVTMVDVTDILGIRRH
jgi:co-chaperonin GroES (HSP10)